MNTWALFLCGDELPTVMGSKTDVESEYDKYQERWMDKRVEPINDKEEQEYRAANVPYIT